MLIDSIKELLATSALTDTQKQLVLRSCENQAEENLKQILETFKREESNIHIFGEFLEDVHSHSSEISPKYIAQKIVDALVQL